MAIETSRPTTIEEPTYYVNGVLHYAVDHTPSIFCKTASKSISVQVAKYLPIIMMGQEMNNDILRPAIILENGRIYDYKIFENRDRKDVMKL